MKNIVSAFSMLLVLMINSFVGIGLIGVSGEIAAAKEYKADVIAEIENSNFNQHVINGCIEQAKASGYKLTVTNCSYDDNRNIQSAEVILGYTYEIPILGIKDTRMTRGVAR